MAKVTDPALILPISDIDLSRDENRKLRVAGHVTAVCPSDASLIVLTDPFPSSSSGCGSILVDLSLCTDQSSDTGGAGWSKKHPQQVPPDLKAAVMVIGHLTRRSQPVDVGFLRNPEKADWSQVQVRSAVPIKRGATPNRFFVLEALLVRALDHTFDLGLWNRAARVRSEHQWRMYRLEVEQQQQQQQKQEEEASRAGPAAVVDRKGKRKAIVID
ncbi:uncharacterized protein SRS1_12174 [Sporisorium reilianum f. sp. reilianum]|uniref:Uncharacterized protein n=1 Tax=Sporisorium reilianum f. sp. reilianum TaxID=72559 RepID=A0A2N8U853_9BASI|nr:uncharacterized protein SRS1_12174 [Sporisorium reilianum f. sp. reilianum]